MLINQQLVTDTWFWIALVDEHDFHHKQAVEIFQKIRRCIILLPWPVTYETLSTEFVSNRLFTGKFEKALKNSNIKYVDDSPYKIKALTDTINSSKENKRKISMVDMIIRMILQDVKFRIKYLLTNNLSDFSDICKKRQIMLINRSSQLN